jgi:hypothetical protein
VTGLLIELVEMDLFGIGWGGATEAAQVLRTGAAQRAAMIESLLSKVSNGYDRQVN